MKNLNRHPRNTGRRGVSLAPVMMFALGFSMIGASILSLGVTRESGEKKRSDKWQSDTLAEGAASKLYEQIRVQMIADQSFPFSLPEETITVTTPSGATQTIGKRSAVITDQREVQEYVTYGTSRYRKYTYYFTIEAKGQAEGGVESIVRTRWKGTMFRYVVRRDVYSETGTPDQFAFPAGALSSNGGVKIVSNSGFEATSLSADDAFIASNTGLSWDVKSGSKTAITASDFIKTRGYYLVPDGAPYAASVAGMGNSNGTVNFDSPAAPAVGDFPGAPEDSIIRLENAMDFADETTVGLWRKDWQTHASASGGSSFPPGNVQSGDIGLGGDGKRRLQAPAIIDGDLEVADGHSLNLIPASSNPKKNVVYVRGKIKNRGTLINNGVTLVSLDGYEDEADAMYKVEEDPALFKTREVALMRSALISLNKSPDSIHFASERNSTIGLVYATLGGIKVTSGNNTRLAGALIAGGTGADGGIEIAPRDGSKFTLQYESYAATGGELTLDAASVIDTDYVAGNVSSHYEPGRMNGWVRVK